MVPPFLITAMKKYFYFILFTSLLGFVSCGGNDDTEKEQVDSKELFRQKLLGDWTLQTYISYEKEGNKNITVKDLSAEQIDYYGLGHLLDITFTDNLFYCSPTDSYYKDKTIKYEIIDWNKNWGDEYFEYVLNVYFPNSNYKIGKGGAKFMDNNTLKWMAQTRGYIFKRK